MSREFDFPPSAIESVRMRSAYHCNSPTCNEITIAPAESGKSYVVTGEAGHIHSGSSKGPRFDGSLSIDFLKSLSNAIWLCRNCHKVVDAEDSRIQASELVRWKTEAESALASAKHVPPPPKVTITRWAASVPTSGSGVMFAGSQPHAGNGIGIRNETSRQLSRISIRIQWFEPVHSVRVRQPHGYDGKVSAVIGTMPLTPTYSGSGKLHYEAPNTAKVWQFAISVLPAGGHISFDLNPTSPPTATSDPEEPSGLLVWGMETLMTHPATVDESLGDRSDLGESDFHAIGSYWYSRGDQHFPRDFFVRFNLGEENRIDAETFLMPPPFAVTMLHENTQSFALVTGEDGAVAIQGPPLFSIQTKDGIKAMRPTIALWKKKPKTT